MRPSPRLIAATATAGLLLAACSSAADSTSDADAAGTTSVVAAFYPLEYAAEAVGGDAVTVTSLTPPGAEPHDIELSAAQVAQIAEADLVLYIRGFQPAIDEAVDQQAADRSIDVASGLPLLSGADAAADPHVWLDPANMAAIGEAIGARVSEITPASATTVDAATAEFSAEMAALDEEFATGLATCAIRDLVVSHEAFGYLADAYGFQQVGLSGLSPEAEPSPARLKEVADLVRTNGITTIYYETLVDPKVAQTVADETGATTAVLDPLEGLEEGATGDYVSIMQENLATLRTGQSCT